MGARQAPTPPSPEEPEDPRWRYCCHLEGEVPLEIQIASARPRPVRSMGGDGRRRDGDGNWRLRGTQESAKFNDNDDHFPEIIRRAEPARPPTAPPEPGSQPNSSRIAQEPRAAPDFERDDLHQ
eukprot:gnl/MRDRNA2_/MRDRNA2_99956_c0_seq1.p1 gnl/MRDRNA2_/MRDRNA2_99956_c0~~gnl/MRDRNA2_/MRDRNA2_99956_c0_seq1.p1  ORF type:complete len:124 (+),score=15.41 gnl/MRDRNA2_/MRDRNA2_99956_c0_seq1:63-434(+)